MSSRRSLSSLSFLCALAVTTLPALAQRAVQSAQVPAMVRDGRAGRVGPMNDDRQLEFVISLPLRNQAAMAGVMADLYNPQSPGFHKWLTPDQFDAQFGPDKADFSALVEWARANGLRIVSKAANRHILTVSGTVAVINSALHITLTNYRNSTENLSFFAPDRQPTLDLDVPVLAVSGLDTSHPRVNFHQRAPGADAASGTRTSAPASSATAPRQPSILGSGPSNTYLPSDMRAAYYGNGPLTGAGQTVAIFSYDGYLANDLAVYTSNTGMATNIIPVTNVLTGGFSGGCVLNTPCDDGEQILDIVQVMGMAPGLAGISFYEGLSAVTELNQMVSDNTASVITSSWGGGDFGPATDPIFQQMALQGQTYLNATGDSGAFNAFTYLPASLSPYIVQVGGTSLVTAAAGGPWASETAWTYSGGGYFDPGIVIPSWQQTPGVITAANSGSSTLRNSPDLAAEGDFDNSLVSNGSFKTGYGGTSYATPRLAGYLALANQQSVINGYSRLGFINPLLYDLGLRPTPSTYYHDITSGSNPATEGPRVSFSAVAGYDLVTGWGSPNGPGLLNALTGPNFSFQVSPTSVTVARGTSVSVDVPIALINGLTGTPAFTVTGLPSSVSAVVVSNSATDATITFTASSSALLSTSTVTVTGTANSISHSQTLLLTTSKRAMDDFTISAGDASVAQLATGTSTITVSPGAGLVGPISLTVGALPTGVTASLSPASTYASSTLTFSASILAVPGTYSVVVTGNAGGTSFSHSATLKLTITAAASIIMNGGFETGANSPWTGTSSGQSGLAVVCNRSCGNYPHSGTYYAYLDGYGATHTDRMYQTVTLPTGVTSATLNFWLWISSLETTTTAKNDNLTVQILNSSGTVLSTVATFSNLNQGNGYVFYSYDVSAYLGQTVRVQFTGTEKNSLPTGFLLDDISITTK